MSETEGAGVHQTKTSAPDAEPKHTRPEKSSADEHRAKLNYIQRIIPGWFKSGAISTALAVAAVVEACGGGQDVVTHPTPQKFTPGVNVETSTPALPSPTATIEATKTAQPTKTPETAPTAQATETQEAAVQPGFKIILNPDVVGPFDEDKTVHEFKTRVETTADQILPKIKGINFDVEIFQGNPNTSEHYSYSEFVNGRPRIRINSRESTAKLAFVLGHEWAHIITNKEYMKNILSPKNYQEWKIARYTANHDENWGIPENADPLITLLTDDMSNVNFPITKDTPIGIVQAISKRYQGSTLLTGELNPDDQLVNPLKTQIGLDSPDLAFVKSEIQMPLFTEQKVYQSLDEFFLDPQITDLFARVETAKPALAIGIEKLKQDSYLFAGRRGAITSVLPARKPILDTTRGLSVDATLNFAIYEFMQKLRIADPAATNSLTAAELEADQKFLNTINTEAEDEGIADQIAVSLLRPDLKPPARQLINIVQEN